MKIEYVNASMLGVKSKKGVVYKVTFLDGLYYIGQTKNLSARMNTAKRDAMVRNLSNTYAKRLRTALENGELLKVEVLAVEDNSKLRRDLEAEFIDLARFSSTSALCLNSNF